MLFKILHGNDSRISTDITPYHEGYCYVTHSGDFYVDMNGQRIKLNAKNADTVGGASLATTVNFSDEEIPTSLAVANLVYDMTMPEIAPIEFEFDSTAPTNSSPYTLVYPELDSGKTVAYTLGKYIKGAEGRGARVYPYLKNGDYLINAEGFYAQHLSDGTIGTLYFSFLYNNQRYFLQVGGDWPNGNGYKESIADDELDANSTDPVQNKVVKEAIDAVKYTHPTYTAYDSGLYNITVDGEGHVSSATAIEAGGGISISDNIIKNTGVRSISTSVVNGYIKVNTNGVPTDIKVQGLASAAYTESSDYAPATHTHTGDDVILTDTVTGTQYKLVMTDGKLTVESVT